MDHILKDCFNGRECTAPKAEGGGREPCGLCKGEGKQQETCNDVSIILVAVVVFFDVVVVVCGLCKGEGKQQETCNDVS